MLRTTNYTVDRDHRILDCCDESHAALKQSVGMNVLEAFPGLGEAGLERVILDGWEFGCASRVIFYAGTLAHIAANTATVPGVLSITVQPVPIAGLREALAAADGWLREAHLAAA